jgi:hypothetical protein
MENENEWKVAPSNLSQEGKIMSRIWVCMYTQMSICAHKHTHTHARVLLSANYFFFFLLFLVVLCCELRASRLLSRCSYHLSHSASSVLC